MINKKFHQYGCWELTIKCADGLDEYQGYDTESEAFEEGERLIQHNDIISYSVKYLSLCDMLHTWQHNAELGV